MSSIKITYKNTDYTLEFSRKTASVIEKAGFDYSEIATKPNGMIPLLLQGAFMKWNPKIKPGKIDEIYNEITDKAEFINVLVELYLETVQSLLGDDGEETKGNATWVKV